MLVDWDESDTWNSMNGNGAGGVQADGIEAALIATTTDGGGLDNSVQSLDVTADLQAWSNGASNHGWALINPVSHAFFFGSDWGSSPRIRIGRC